MYLVATHHSDLQECCLHQLLKPSRIWGEGCWKRLCFVGAGRAESMLGDPVEGLE